MTNHTFEIRINRFGPIKDQTVALAPFMLFTGNSNMGKSYVNYLCYYVIKFFTTSLSNSIFEGKLKAKGENKYECEISDNDVRRALVKEVQPFMRDFLGDSELLCDVSFIFNLPEDCEKDKIRLSFQHETKEDRNHGIGLMTFYQLSINKSLITGVTYSVEEDVMINLINRHLNKYFQKHLLGEEIFSAIIMPPARGSFVGERFGLKSNIASQAGMYRRFLNDYDWSLKNVNYNNKKDTDSDQFFKSRIASLIKGNLITENGQEKLMLPNGYKLPLTAAASSIKELSPLLFFLKNWSAYPLSFCIEEPEAHLHPSMQVDVADLLAICRNKGMYFQMTTHSDYFIQRINQLVLLGDMRKKNQSAYDEFRKTKGLNQRAYLNREDVVCYYFHEDDNKNVKIDKLTADEDGIQLKTFYDVIRKMADFDDVLQLAINQINKNDVE